MQLQKVLIPLDGSRLAERCLVYVPALVRIRGLQVTLLSVVDEDEDVKMLSQSEATDRERNVLQTYLHEVATDMKKHLGIEVATEVLVGRPADLILERVQTSRPDLLIVSTHGRSGISRWRIGSVADKLIRGAGCTTLVVGPHADDKGWLETDALAAFKKILVPLDGSPLGEQALETAQLLAAQFDSEIHLVRIVSLPVYGNGFVMESGYSAQLIDNVMEGAKEYVARIAKDVKAPGGTTTAAIMGTAAITLESYIEENGIDLVVMTSHGRGGIVRAALGSVTDRLLGGAAPVMVVRATAAAK